MWQFIINGSKCPGQRNPIRQAIDLPSTCIPDIRCVNIQGLSPRVHVPALQIRGNRTQSNAPTRPPRPRNRSNLRSTEISSLFHRSSLPALQRRLHDVSAAEMEYGRSGWVSQGRPESHPVCHQRVCPVVLLTQNRGDE